MARQCSLGGTLAGQLVGARALVCLLLLAVQVDSIAPLAPAPFVYLKVRTCTLVCASALHIESSNGLRFVGKYRNCKTWCSRRRPQDQLVRRAAAAAAPSTALRVRRELRTLDTSERDALFEALWYMKNTSAAGGEARCGADFRTYDYFTVSTSA